FINNLIIWSNMQHKNILPLLGANVVIPQPYIVNPFLSNGNMIGYLNEYPHKALNILNEVINFIKDICTGLLYLHNNGIVHGDLRGEHVLIDENKHIKITEYGIAQVQSNVNENFLSKTNNSVVINYNCWTAPELYLRNQVPTEKSDVYSFGMLCYEILYGNPPFEYRDARELKENVCIYKLRPQRSKLNISCPDWLWQLITECWKAEASERKTLKDIMEVLR
ncbi:kinase-like protein, partial [Anaeromyces robustus]